MKKDQKELAEVILQCIQDNKGTGNADQLFDAVEKAGFDPYKSNYSHIKRILEQQEIIINVDDGNYMYEMSDKGYKVSHQGYSQWLKERDKLENIKNKNVKTSYIGQIVSISIAVIALANTFYSNYNYQSEIEDMKARIELIQNKQKQYDDIEKSEVSSPDNQLMLRDTTTNDTIQ